MIELAAFFGETLIDACFRRAKSVSQCIQFAYDDALWLALDIANGNNGLED